MSNEVRIPMYRTINECYNLIKQMDPETAITTWHLRCLKDKLEIITMSSGNKVLIEFNSLLAYLNKGEKANESNYNEL